VLLTTSGDWNEPALLTVADRALRPRQADWSARHSWTLTCSPALKWTPDTVTGCPSCSPRPGLTVTAADRGADDGRAGGEELDGWGWCDEWLPPECRLTPCEARLVAETGGAPALDEGAALLWAEELGGRDRVGLDGVDGFGAVALPAKPDGSATTEGVPSVGCRRRSPEWLAQAASSAAPTTTPTMTSAARSRRYPRTVTASPSCARLARYRTFPITT